MKKKNKIAIGTLLLVQAAVNPMSVLAQEVEVQETITLENTERNEEKERVEKEESIEELQNSTEEIEKEKEELKTLKEIAEEVAREKKMVNSGKEKEEKASPQVTSHNLSKDKFHQYVLNENLTGLRFVASEIPAGIDAANQTDLSETGDGSVIGYKDGTIGIITSGVAGQSVVLPSDSSGLFSGYSTLTSIQFEAIDTASVTNMSRLFNECSGLTTLDVSTFNTSNVTDMSDMFRDCSGLTSLDVTNFDTANVTNMGVMFYGCSGLTSLDVSRFNTSNVTSMGYMFYGCSGLTALDVTKFNTSKVTNMWSMFDGCSGLSSLDVTKFDTSNVTNMGYMFSGCSGLSSLDLTNFNVSNVTNLDCMFQWCDHLVTIYANDWSLVQNSSSAKMFSGAINLIGIGTNNQITSYEEAKIDGTMATSNGGYFTVPYKKAAIVNFIDDQGQVQKKVPFALSQDEMNISEDKVSAEIPAGYETKNPLPSFEVPVTGTTFDVVIQPILVNWAATVNYVSNGQIVGTKGFQVTNRQPEISVSDVQAGIPAGYEAVGQVTGFTATKDGEVFEVEVAEKEVQWTATVKYVTADGTEAGVQNFTVTNKNPKILAADIEKNIPQGYVATGTITDQTVTQNNEVIAVQVGPEEVQWTVTINYVSNTRAVVGSANFQVTNLNPVVTAAQITGAIPAGYEGVGTITDITATQDGQSFNVQVQPVTAPAEETWAIEVNFKDEAGNIVGNGSFIVSSKNPVISLAELNKQLPTGYKLVLEQPVTVLAESIVNGAGTIVVPVSLISGSQDNNSTGGSGNEGLQDPNKNGGVNTSTQMMTGLYTALGVGAVAPLSSIFLKKRKKK